MGVHSPCSLRSLNEAGFILLLSTRSHLLPIQICLSVSRDTAQAFPKTDLDISTSQQFHRWVSSSADLAYPSCPHSLILEATLTPLVCLPLAGPAIPALDFHSTPCQTNITLWHLNYCTPPPPAIYSWRPSILTGNPLHPQASSKPGKVRSPKK